MSDYWDRPVYDDIAAEHHGERMDALAQGRADAYRDWLDQATDEEIAAHRARPRGRLRTYGGR